MSVIKLYMKNSELVVAIERAFTEQSTIISRDLVAFVSSVFPELSPSTIAWKINQLKSEGLIYQMGRGVYTFNFKPDFKPEISLKTKRLYNKTKLLVPSELVVWDTEMLDFILDNDSEKRLTFLLIKKEELILVFEKMQYLSKPVFLEPSNEIIQRYILPQNDVVLLYPLISETPIHNNVDYLVPSIEGILVNAWLLSENYLKPLGYSIEKIFEHAFVKYNVNKKKLLRYASRRDQRKEIEQLIQTINNE